MWSRLSAVFAVSAAVAASSVVSFAQTQASPPRFELVGESEDWLAFRENIRDAREPSADCRYPGLADGVRGVTLHFLELSDRHDRGDLMPVDRFAASFPVYETASATAKCTPAPVAAQRQKEAAGYAAKRGITLTPPKAPMATFGSPVRAATCEPLKKATASTACDAMYQSKIDGSALRIVRILTAVPRAPDYSGCQFVGHQFVVGLQVTWMNLGTAESLSVPGGVAEHYDCRPQSFMPIRLYALAEHLVVMTSFRGDNIADSTEHQYVLVMPRTP
jgi:hypothetical protein